MTATTESQTILSNHGERPGPDLADTRAGFLALRSRCGVYDLSDRAKISVTGGDRVRWLNGMASNNIRDLAVGHGVYAFLLNAQGRIQADLYAYNFGDSFILDVDGRHVERVLSHFDKFIIMDDVEVKTISQTLTAIGVAGPKSQEILRQAGIEAPGLAPLQFCSPTCNCDCGCTQCTLVRGDSPAGTAYEIWLAPDKKKPTWDALVAAGATPVDMHAAELFRISLGVPQFGTDIRERDLPQETGQTRALNFTKGCYLGQEIVERIRSRGAVHRQFTAFKVEGPLPEPGTKIVATEKEVGEVTSSAVLPLPSGDTPVALGYLRREAAEKELLAGSAKLKVAALPIA
ncbi:MAG TPA: folate-binding protein, partial [Terriglobales bacterium]|nr:folate-binding protein [Terriglobales bacterium]